MRPSCISAYAVQLLVCLGLDIVYLDTARVWGADKHTCRCAHSPYPMQMQDGIHAIRESFTMQANTHHTQSTHHAGTAAHPDNFGVVVQLSICALPGSPLALGGQNRALLCRAGLCQAHTSWHGGAEAVPGLDQPALGREQAALGAQP